MLDTASSYLNVEKKTTFSFHSTVPEDPLGARRFNGRRERGGEIFRSDLNVARAVNNAGFPNLAPTDAVRVVSP